MSDKMALIPSTFLGAARVTVTFMALRIANERRVGLFRNGRGERAHEEADGSDWSPAEWSNAAAGEVGELCNKTKKLRRGDFGRDAAWLLRQPVGELTEDQRTRAATLRAFLSEEIAGAVIYLDILAKQIGLDLGEAVVQEFNRKSVDFSLPVMIEGKAADR